jgi:hypothetical protein
VSTCTYGTIKVEEGTAGKPLRQISSIRPELTGGGWGTPTTVQAVLTSALYLVPRWLLFLHLCGEWYFLLVQGCVLLPALNNRVALLPSSPMSNTTTA